MTTPEPRTRRCQGCGYRFRPDADELFCSATCAGSLPVTTLLLEARRLAAWQVYAMRRSA